MFLRKANNHFSKKVAAIALSAMTLFSATSLLPDKTAMKAEAASRFPDGIYYIQNVHSGLFMDVYNNQASDGTPVIQYSYNGNRNQKFKIQYHDYYGGYYTIQAMHGQYNNCMLDLNDLDSSKRNGTDLQIWLDCSSYVAEQRYTITPASGGGYEIGTWASGGKEVLEVTSSSMASGAVIQIWEHSTARNNDNWNLIPAKTNVALCATTPLSYEDRAVDRSSKAIFDRLGYSAIFYNDTPNNYLQMSKEEIKNKFENSAAVVIHGHGDPGCFYSDTSKGKHTITITAKEISLYKRNNSLQLVYFGSCFGAATKDRDGKSCYSCVDAAIEMGAKCSIGFKRAVEGSEDFLNSLLNTLELHKNWPLKDAIDWTLNLPENAKFVGNLDYRFAPGYENMRFDLR